MGGAGSESALYNVNFRHYVELCKCIIDGYSTKEKQIKHVCVYLSMTSMGSTLNVIGQGGTFNLKVNSCEWFCALQLMPLIDSKTSLFSTLVSPFLSVFLFLLSASLSFTQSLFIIIFSTYSCGLVNTKSHTFSYNNCTFLVLCCSPPFLFLFFFFFCLCLSRSPGSTFSLSHLFSCSSSLCFDAL